MEQPTKQDLDLDYSRPLDVHRWSDYPEVNEWVGTIWERHIAPQYASSGRGKPAKSSPKKQFKVLLLDLYVAWTIDPALFIGISMSNSGYKSSRYNALHISNVMIKLVNILTDAELIDKHIGSEASRRTTRIRASDKLVQMFEAVEFGEFDIHQHEDREVIILNEKGFNEVTQRKTAARGKEYSDSDYGPIVEMREQLKAYNSLLARTYIDIGSLQNPHIERIDKKTGKISKVPIDQTRKFVARIFYRGDWSLGGRFHGGFWQQVGEHYRSDILINDQRTVEIDYSGMHINLAYGLERQTPSKDPYQIGDFHNLLGIERAKQRKVVKQLVLNALNAKSPKQAMQAFRNEQDTGSPLKKLRNSQLLVLLEAFAAQNEPIKKYISTDSGVALMNIDGRITSRIIEHFTEKNIPVLTVHDSYIVPFGYDTELISVMNNATRHELGGFNIGLDVSSSSMGFVNHLRARETMDRGQDYLTLKAIMERTKRCEGYLERLIKYERWSERAAKKDSYSTSKEGKER